MEQSSFQDEQTVRHQFDSLCKLALKSEVINYENNGGYNPVEIYNNDPDIHRVVDQLIDGTYSNGDTEMYRDLYNSLLKTQGGARADMYFILKDFRAYADAQKRVEEAYKDTEGWAKKALLNTACCG